LLVFSVTPLKIDQNKNKSKSKPLNRSSPEFGRRKRESVQTPAKSQVTAIFLSTAQASQWLMPGTVYMSAINVHKCRSVVPGRARGHVPGMSAAYENQA